MVFGNLALFLQNYAFMGTGFLITSNIKYSNIKTSNIKTSFLFFKIARLLRQTQEALIGLDFTANKFFMKAVLKSCIHLLCGVRVFTEAHWAFLLQCTDYSCGTCVSLVASCRFGCSLQVILFPDQGSNLCPLLCKVDS